MSLVLSGFAHICKFANQEDESKYLRGQWYLESDVVQCRQIRDLVRNHGNQINLDKVRLYLRRILK